MPSLDHADWGLGVAESRKPDIHNEHLRKSAELALAALATREALTTNINIRPNIVSPEPATARS